MSWIESPSWKAAVAPDPVGDAGHICLVGSRVSSDWALVTALKQRHQVTVAESAEMLAAGSLLGSVDVLALECSGGADVAQVVRGLLAKQPRLCVVLVGEALSQNQIAEAFREGALDFFSEPRDPQLLAERVHSLCRLYRRGRIRNALSSTSNAVS